MNTTHGNESETTNESNRKCNKSNKGPKVTGGQLVEDLALIHCI